MQIPTPVLTQAVTVEGKDTAINYLFSFLFLLPWLCKGTTGSQAVISCCTGLSVYELAAPAPCSSHPPSDQTETRDWS